MATIKYKVSEIKRVGYNNYDFCVDIINLGIDNIFVNWNEDAIIDNPNSLLLERRCTYDIRQIIRTESETIDLNIISASPAVVQVVRVVR